MMIVLGEYLKVNLQISVESLLSERPQNAFCSGSTLFW